MIVARTNRWGLVASLAVVTLVLHWATGSGSALAQSPTTGKVELEGQSIARLVLRREGDNKREEIRRPEGVIELPTGQYRVQDVLLEEGYRCAAPNDTVTVRSDETATLKVGGPLKQTVTVSRQGRLLVMDHELVGIGGERYASGGGGEPPTFTVYRGDKEIATGAFEYG